MNKNWMKNFRFGVSSWAKLSKKEQKKLKDRAKGIVRK